MSDPRSPWIGGGGSRAWHRARAIERRDAEARRSFAQLDRTPGPLYDRDGLTPAQRVRALVAQDALRRVLGRRTLPW